LQRNKMPLAEHRSLPLTARTLRRKRQDLQRRHLVMFYKHCPATGILWNPLQLHSQSCQRGIAAQPTKKPRRNAALLQRSLAGDYSMIPKSGYRFSEEIMLKSER
jgi:hypothetical protein